MRITMLAKKGGVGKSTLALLLHEAFRQAGNSVAIRDWDAQGTSTKALRLMGGQQAMLAGPYEVLLYDTPPNLEHVATGYAVHNTALALVVTSPSPADIWEADEALRFVQAKNPHAVARLIFNKVRRGTVLARLIDARATQVRVPALATIISDRECYKHAIGEGWKALDGPAREAVQQFTVALLSLGR